MKTLIKNANIVNEGKVLQGSVLIENNIISKISPYEINVKADKVIDAKGNYLFPGCIDDQVHFREPGLTHKGEIYTEAKAAVERILLIIESGDRGQFLGEQEKIKL